MCRILPVEKLITILITTIIIGLDVVVILYIAAIMNLALFHFHIIICICRHTQCTSSNKVCGQTTITVY